MSDSAISVNFLNVEHSTSLTSSLGLWKAGRTSAAFSSLTPRWVVLTAQGTALLASRKCLYVSGVGGNVPTCPQGQELNAFSRKSMFYRPPCPFSWGPLSRVGVEGGPQCVWGVDSWEMTCFSPAVRARCRPQEERISGWPV